jgi:hypothetical protein
LGLVNVCEFGSPDTLDPAATTDIRCVICVVLPAESCAEKVMVYVPTAEYVCTELDAAENAPVAVESPHKNW